MRRTLTVLAATAALLVPAGVALAGNGNDKPNGPGTNASCNNGKGGNYDWTGDVYNEQGNGKKKDVALCGTETPPPTGGGGENPPPPPGGGLGPIG